MSSRKATRKVTVVTNVRAEGEEPTEVRLATITEYVCYRKGIPDRLCED